MARAVRCLLEMLHEIMDSSIDDSGGRLIVFRGRQGNRGAVAHAPGAAGTDPGLGVVGDTPSIRRLASHPCENMQQESLCTPTEGLSPMVTSFG